jgi:hypothetical protein
MTLAQGRYNTDFFAWLKEQATALRARNFECLDVDNLVEELDAMAGSLRRELKSRLHTLLVHLLKWQLLTRQRDREGRGWNLTIREQRRQICDILKDSPSLRFHLPELFIDAWQWACEDFRDLGFKHGLPEICPWDFEMILTEAFIPGRQE